MLPKHLTKHGNTPGCPVLLIFLILPLHFCFPGFKQAFLHINKSFPKPVLTAKQGKFAIKLALTNFSGKLNCMVEPINQLAGGTCHFLKLVTRMNVYFAVDINFAFCKVVQHPGSFLYRAGYVV